MCCYSLLPKNKYNSVYTTFMNAVFERKISSVITDYFETDDAPILIIDGAPQVGKSFIIRELGMNHYSHYVEINLKDESKNSGIFRDIHSTKDLYYAVQSIAGRPLGNYDDTLVFLDEIQEYGHLLTLLKFLRTEHRYRFIACGSHIRAKLLDTASIPIGSISLERMYPMDIEEFLWANGIPKDLVYELKTMMMNGDSIPDGLHRRIMDLFKDYLICGGLPHCVELFLRERDVVRLREAQKEIYRHYLSMALKNDLENRMHTKAVLDSIPSGIRNGRKRLFAKDIEGREHAHFCDYRDDINYLVDSGMILRVICSSRPTFPLERSSKENLLKLHMCDVGILTYLLYGNDVRPLRGDLPREYLRNVYGCVAAMQLSANGHNLYYCDEKSFGEADYLIDDYDGLSVKAIGIKSEKNHKRHNSIDKLVRVNKSCKGLVISNSGTIEMNDRIVHLPIYALIFI